ncbi:YfhO family protein [Myxococcus qinghaiensis]|uniref:YfhO family protein n=1 Tax=Myxococcus qinghaiensis TaxID=2906758 RepID=UPI0020A6E97B|nr:YfhO family protein [Myxococcus qinghaiensis]MCP3164774.1 YfhO family protein [Myxococcus qinghaiensis]
MLVACALGLTALYFYRVPLTGEMFSARDSLYVYLPVFHVWSEAVLAGRIPEWLTLDGFGQPYAGTLVVAPFHPSKLLYLLLSLDQAFNANILLCFPSALLGTYALTRLWEVPRPGAFLAGMAYAFSGYLVCITNNLCYLMAAATVPWALWAAERQLRAPGPGRLLLAGALLSLVLFAGDVQAFCVTYGLVVLLALSGPAVARRSRLLAMSGTLGVGTLLAAPQLFSSVSLMRTAEAGGRTLDIAQEFALHPLRLLEPLLGPYLVFPAQAPEVSKAVVTRLAPSGFASFWVNSIHLGVPVLLLAGTGAWRYRRSRRLWLWGSVWLLVLGLALGPALPLYEAAYAWVPPWRVFRYPSKLVPFLGLGVCFLAALGWKGVFQGEARRAFLRLAVTVVGGCLVLAAAERFGQAFTSGLLVPRWPEMPQDLRELLSSRFVVVCLVASAGAALCWVCVLQPRWSAGVLLVTQFMSSAVASEGLYELLTPEVLSTPPPFVEHILAQPRVEERVPVRVASHYDVGTLTSKIEGLDALQRRSLGAVQTLMPDTPGLWGLESAEVNLPAGSRRVRAVVEEVTPWFLVRAPLFSVAYSVHPFIEWKPLEAAGKKLVGADASLGAVMVEHPGVLPRAFLANARCVDSYEAAMPLLEDALVRSGQVALVECGEAGPGLAPGDTAVVGGKVRVERYEAETLVFDVESPRDAVLVVNDAWFPGWTASVDGVEASILPANVAVRAVPVKAGRHQVTMAYRDLPARWGLGVSALTFLGLLGMAVARGRRARSA